MFRVTSLRSGFRRQALASLTPAKRLNFALRAPNDNLLLIWAAAVLGSCGTGTHSCPCFGIPFEETSTGKSAGATKAWSFLVSTCPAGLRLPMTIAIFFRDAYKYSLRQTVRLPR